MDGWRWWHNNDDDDDDDESLGKIKNTQKRKQRWITMRMMIWRMERKGNRTKTIPVIKITSEEVKREWSSQEFITITFEYFARDVSGCTEDEDNVDDDDNEEHIAIEMRARMDIMPSRIIRT